MSAEAAEQDDQETLLFSAALDKVHQLHLKQVAELKTSLLQQREVNMKQKEQLTLMKRVVSSAKLKIGQQAIYISELKQLLDNLQKHDTSNSRTVCAEQTHQLLESDKVYESPVQLGIRAEETRAHPGDCGLDKTCPPLFESPTVLVTSTPSLRQRYPCITDTQAPTTAITSEVQFSEKSKQQGVPEETEGLEDMADHEDDWMSKNESSDITSDESMNALLDDSNQEVIYIRGDSQNGSQLIRSPTCREDGECAVSFGMTSLDEDLRNSEDELPALASRTCVSMFGNNTRTSPKALRLRKDNIKAKKIIYRETDKSANVSMPTTSSTASLEHNSLLNETPVCTPEERESFSENSTQDLDSPPFLCTTLSPLKAQPSPLPCTSPQAESDSHDGMSMSMFPSTPVPLRNTSNSNLKRHHLHTRNHSVPIPQSDSQFSLNISQSLPLSPEVRTETRPMNFTNEVDCDLLECPDNDVHTLQASQQGTKADSTREKPGPERRENGQLEQLTLKKLMIPLIEEGSKCCNGQTESSVDMILRTPSTSHMTVIPTTPGISTVDSILSHPTDWGVVNQPAPILTSNYEKERNIQINNPVKPRRIKATKRNILDVQDTATENEEIIPAKRKQNSNNYPGHSKPGAALLKTDTSQELHHQISSPVLVGHSRALLRELSTCRDTLIRKSSRPVRTILIDEGLEDDQEVTAKRMARKAGLPEYKCVTKILSKTDRDKLDGKACPECQAWYDSSDGIHQDKRGHLKHTCRHKNLYQPPDSNPNLWNISFPDSEECDNIMKYS